MPLYFCESCIKYRCILRKYRGLRSRSLKIQWRTTTYARARYRSRIAKKTVQVATARLIRKPPPGEWSAAVVRDLLAGGDRAAAACALLRGLPDSWAVSAQGELQLSNALSKFHEISRNCTRILSDARAVASASVTAPVFYGNFAKIQWRPTLRYPTLAPLRRIALLN